MHPVLNSSVYSEYRIPCSFQSALAVLPSGRIPAMKRPAASFSLVLPPVTRLPSSVSCAPAPVPAFLARAAPVSPTLEHSPAEGAQAVDDKYFK